MSVDKTDIKNPIIISAIVHNGKLYQSFMGTFNSIGYKLPYPIQDGSVDIICTREWEFRYIEKNGHPIITKDGMVYRGDPIFKWERMR